VTESAPKKRPDRRPAEKRPAEKKPAEKKKTSARPRPKQTPKGQALRWTLGVMSGLVTAGALAMAFVYPRTQSSPAPVASPAPSESRLVVLVLAADESRGDVARKLGQAGLLDDPWLFTGYLELQRIVPAPGVHLLPRGLSHGELAARLARRGQSEKVVVPEGWTRFDIARRLAEHEVCDRVAFLAATQDPALLSRLRLKGDSAEGFLFPATYDLPKDSDPEKLVERFVQELEKRLETTERKTPEGRLLLARTLGFGTLEILTLASVVEREAAVAEERPLIASVFLNRLRDPSFPRHVLQSDPTSGYGCVRARELFELKLSPAPAPSSCAEYIGRILPVMNQDPQNPYSTYSHEGLPPGPIANPGQASIAAVLAPAETNYLYFVAKGAGRHAFSATFEEHKKNIGH